ncbi:hypothetical protein AJ80_06458 [Polytolypa hystricis UAMH7299]|uniref:RING-type domain-containing protein n=1 Tax=Polytolypa hystricis (strain UAMH7299) TaxID=1447883 RepID=A0A2B7XV53_POLH7|nr:hypothetical protein AJ80_06458 [Polytolypa hystricis UAMH7299]
MAHSKRNTSLPHFTSYERSLLRSTWGTQRTRLSRESFLPFASCGLCLLPARAPVVACATNGDIFCRECAVNDLLAQRKEIKRMERETKMLRGDEVESERLLGEEARERAVREFEMVSMGMEEERKRKFDGEEMERGGEGEGEGELGRKRRKGEEFELDEGELTRIAKEERERMKREIEMEKSESSKAKLPSFWIPSLTPSTNGGNDKPAKLNPMCPASTPENKHSYSLKLLVDVHFAEDKGDGQSGNTVRICPSCKKVLNNGLKAMCTKRPFFSRIDIFILPYSWLTFPPPGELKVTKPCGHVICKPCVDKFMTPHDTPDPHATDPADKELHGRMLCYVCETDITERKQSRKEEAGGKKKKEKIRPGLVSVNSEGTGFAGGGGNIASRKGTAFQC